jgi:ABC transporter
LPATAFAFGADIVADYEYAQQGVQNWNRSEGDYSFDTCLTMLFLDTILYIFLAWYLDQVVPREYGTPRPVWFLFSPYYWCGGMGSGGRDKAATCLNRSFSPCLGDGDAVHITEEGSVDLASSNDNGSDDVEEFAANSNHEQMTDPSLVPQIKICKLTKQYNKRNICNRKHGNGDMPPPAVNQLDLDLYESQITTLLGHNGTWGFLGCHFSLLFVPTRFEYPLTIAFCFWLTGAGKTTVISILTGLFAPTSGDASIYGHSIVKNTAEARRSIGICPQQNVLFERLTVLEHIFFFTRIKGIRDLTMDQAKAQALEIGLGEFLYTTAAALSGGNKRKLCVAVALCGDPKFLVLDEPTSGT